MQEEPSYDPFQLQNAPTVQKFSVQTKIMAIILVFIFVAIPLYEINEHTFQINGIYHEIGYHFSCFGF